MPDHHIAFWNVENLFDVEDAPLDRRPDKIRRALRVGSASSEVKGWTQAVLDRKLVQLASVILRMNAGRGPDVLGLCEVENRHVLDLLVVALAPSGRLYDVVHADTADRRGIDVAFLYDRSVFQVNPAEVFSHFIVKRTATRDLLQVTFRDPQGRALVCIANHWPSRLGGQFESEPFRIIAAETLAYFHERIVDILGKDVAILALGDFNDEPFDRSLAQHARTERTRAKVTRATLPSFLNLMWPPVGQLQGTHFHQNRPGVLDQVLASKGLLTGRTGFVIQPALTSVVAFPDMVKGSQYPQPRRFGRPSSRRNFDTDGFSDHYPIVAVVSSP